MSMDKRWPLKTTSYAIHHGADRGRSTGGGSPAPSIFTGGEREDMYGIGQCYMQYFHHRGSPAPEVELDIFWKFCRHVSIRLLH